MKNTDYLNILSNYEKQIEELRNQVNELTKSSINPSSQAYKTSLSQAKKNYVSRYSARDLNPLIKQIRSKSLSNEEKRNLIFPDLVPSKAEDVYYQWVGPDKLSVTRDKQWYWVVALILGIITVFSLIIREYIFIALAFSVFLLYYILNSVPPSTVIYRLTKQGIEIGEGDNVEIFAWPQLLEYAYYFKHNTEIAYIKTLISVPPKIFLLFSQEDRRNIQIVLEAMLPYQPPPSRQNIFDRVINGTYIPLESFKELQKKIDEFFDRKYADIITQLKNEGRVSNDTNLDSLRRMKAIETVSVVEKLKSDPVISSKLGI